MTISKEEFAEDLNELLEAARQTISKEIDAGNCRTPQDWKEAHEARDREDRLYNGFLSKYSNGKV